MEKNYIDSEKSINSFDMKKERLPYYLLDNFFYQYIVRFGIIIIVRNKGT